ncbi:acetyl-CoA acetyltransferase [Pseudomonas sp. WN033]|nr:acetyl-CoA acetyltransferase [Pseudomonas sp. WN033]
MTGVMILGGAQSDFARNWNREGTDLLSAMREVSIQALQQSGIEPGQIEALHVGNFVAELFAGQGLLGALANQIFPEWHNLPASRHEAACASGSMAILAAMADIQAGRYDCVAVLGVEWMRNVPGQQAADFLGTAAWAGQEGQKAQFLWPFMFAEILELYDQRYGLNTDYLKHISRNNFANAQLNPNAQTRNWQMDDASYANDDSTNPLIEGRLRRSDCGQITDGAACVILVSERWLQRHKATLPPVQILGWGHRGSSISMAHKVSLAENSPWLFPHLKLAIDEALARAGLANAQALDAIETHDCFSMSEYLAIDHFGLTPPGQSWQFIESGDFTLDGRLPINPSGGLIGAGHPVGATGVRMLLDAFKQVRGLAGNYQVKNAKRVATLNFGGSTSAVACLVVGDA